MGAPFCGYILDETLETAENGQLRDNGGATTAGNGHGAG